MKDEIIEIKKGIKLHKINTDKFKTNLIAVFLTTDLNRENVTKNALISSILRRGTMELKNQEEISKKLEEMYGAAFNCGLDKIGDNHVLKFYMDTINNLYLPNNSEDLLNLSIQNLLSIVFNPLVENGKFNEQYVEQEKNNIKQLIEGKIDNKARYAQDRCIEEMFKNENYGLYKFGYVEDLEKIDAKNLYEYYETLINECKIDIFISGKIDENVEQLIKENVQIQKLKEREPKFQKTNISKKQMPKEEKEVTESMEVTQGKLVLGLDIDIHEEDLKYDVLVYNSLLGGSATSKLFQNVREKANLAYVASSSYLRHKNIIIINSGIEIENYQKALEIIKQQIDEMKQGNFEEKELEDTKQSIIATIKTILDEQDTQITYFFGQELSENKITIEDYEKRIQKITKQDVTNISNKIYINVIYFLKD